MRSFDFNCRPIRADDVLCCSFSLQKTDCQLLKIGLSKNRFNVEEMVNETGFERSTVQKSLSRLVKQGIVKRFQENLPEGGYRFWYTVLDKQEITKTVSERVQNWSNHAQLEVEKWLKAMPILKKSGKRK